MMVSGAAGDAFGFRKAEALLEEGIRGKAYTAAVLLAARQEEVVCHVAAGGAHLSSVFDIASLTKPLSAFLFFALAQEGSISPEGRLADVLPPLSSDPAAGEIRFRHLLSHTSGLPPYKPFYEAVLDAEEKENRRLWGTAEAHDRIVDVARSLPPEAVPGRSCVYSDVGFILLGRAIELAAFRPLDRLLHSHLAMPLQMRDTTYLPLAGFSECETGRLVSTGYSEIRRREKLGEVDDENASAMGGVSGHAGIFSTAYDLFLFSREVLRARRGEGRILTRQSARRMTSKAPDPPGCPRTPGWDTPTISSGKVSQAGRHFPEGSFGHLGYTGCSLWIDPFRETAVVLLTNRIFYGKQNEGLKTLRPLIHDAVMEELSH
ncbi:MAG: serine hydrolase domain-containing protein [Deltaproteobacteria bacterium]|nr:serine hydrolase [Candidatus Deferrimicrobiaceae bacterium]